MKPKAKKNNLTEKLSYLFNRNFINNQRTSIKLLDEYVNSFFNKESELFDQANAETYQYFTRLRNDLNKCWTITNVIQLLNKELVTILWVENQINIQIFNPKTNWFLWQNIFLYVDMIAGETAKTTAKTRLNILREISSIFDLGK